MYHTLAKFTMTVTNIGLFLGFLFAIWLASITMTPFLGIPAVLIGGSFIYSLWFMACAAFNKFMNS